MRSGQLLSHSIQHSLCRLNMLFLLRALQKGDSFALGSFLFKAVEALFKDFNLVLQVADLVALGIDLLGLKGVLGGLLLFFGQCELQLANFFELRLDQLDCLLLSRRIVTFLTKRRKPLNLIITVHIIGHF